MNDWPRNGDLSTRLDRERRRIKLVFVGDVMLGRLVNDRLRHVDANYPWATRRTCFAPRTAAFAIWNA